MMLGFEQLLNDERRSYGRGIAGFVKRVLMIGGLIALFGRFILVLIPGSQLIHIPISLGQEHVLISTLTGGFEVG